MMKNILIINAYSYKNRGDSGIIVAMVDLLRDTYGDDVNIAVMSQYYNENIDFYKRINVRSVAPVWNINNAKGFIGKYFQGLKKTIQHKSQDLDELNKANLILSAGGGYLYSSRVGPLGIGFINVLYHIWLSKKLDKKVILFPQSVGPLDSKIDKFFVKKVFNKIDLFYSRERITSNLLKDLKIKTEINEVPDIAFLLNPLKNKSTETLFKPTNDKTQLLGITVLDWKFAKKGSDDKDVENYLLKIKKAIELIENTYKLNVYIFPQVTVSDTDGDLAVSQKLAKMIGANATVISLEGINDPKELVTLYSKMDVFIGSRMHSAIFALAGGVPTIGLAYQPKTTGTFDLLELSEYALDTYSFTSEELSKLLLHLLSSKTNIKEEVVAKVLSSKQKLKSQVSAKLKELQD